MCTTPCLSLVAAIIISVRFMHLGAAISQASPLAEATEAQMPVKTSAAPLVPENKPGFGVIHRGQLEDDLVLLDFYEEQPQASRDFFRAAREALDTAPKGTIAELEAIREAAERHGFTHLGGPMLGAVTHEGARVWLRTIRPAAVSVEVECDGLMKTFGPVASTVESDLTAVVEVTGLSPGRRYAYRVLVDGKPISSPVEAAIPTTPAPGQPAKVRIIFGSCFHKSGLHNPELLRRILKRQPNAALFYGDIAVDDRDDKVGLHRSDYLLRDLSPAWRELAANVPVFATWDDHDYFNNDQWGIPKDFSDADRRAVRKVWTQNWNNPEYGLGDEGGGIFLRTKIGPADVIMVDNRYFRQGPGNEHGFLGAAQMRWLEGSIARCSGPFVLLSCGTMWSDYVSAGKDSWGRYDPEGRQHVFQLLDKKKLPVFLLSGDRHGARGFKIPRPSGRAFYEFGSALLGGHLGPPPWMENCPAQIFGFERRHAFSELELDSTGPGPVATYRLIHQDGTELYRIELGADELFPGAESLPHQ